MKHTLALLVTVSLAYGITPATAADLGGDCCADLEQRVAELEATTARKGNRKVSLTVSGQVNTALMYFDPDIDMGPVPTSKWGVIDNGVSNSRISFDGSAKINAKTSVGFKFEVGRSDLGALNLDDNLIGGGDGLVVRQANWHINGSIGRLTVGKAHTATSGAGQVSVANTGMAVEMLSLEPTSSAQLFGFNVPFRSEVLEDVVRYDSPVLAGFRLSASFQDEDAWDAALRYAGELGDFRLAAAIGYAKEDDIDLGIATIPSFPGVNIETTTLTGSASLMHTPTGLFLNGAYGKADVDVNSSSIDVTAWHIMGGIERKWWSIGKTTLYGEYASLDIGEMEVTPTLWGVGFIQEVEAAATDFYVTARVHDLDLDISDEPTPVSVIAGARIKF